MAEVVETYDLTTPSQDGWAVDYRIRREDGEELHAEVRCWEKARAAAERAGHQLLGLRFHPGRDQRRHIQTGVAVEHQLVVNHL
jgi:hypothetical protein